MNDVLFVDTAVGPLLKDTLAETLMEEVRPQAISVDNAETINVEDFMKSVVPKCQGIDAVLSSAHMGNFMSVTAPTKTDSETNLFQWPNNFAWSYDGDVADSDMRRAVQAKGGRVDGDFRFTHQWNYDKRNASLMDLHVFFNGIAPTNGKHNNYGSGNRVGWNARNHHGTGGTQDIDYVQPAPAGYVPVENITFPSRSKMPNGDYVCKIHNWDKRCLLYTSDAADE